MRAIRGGGENRSSGPRNAINPHDSPRERSTSVAPATCQAGGKSTHALNPAKSDKRPLVEGDEDSDSEGQSTQRYGQKDSSKKKEYKASMMRRRAQKEPRCKTTIWLDEADHEQRVIISHRECDEKRYSREKGYVLEMGKGELEAAPASHHQKPPSNDLCGTQTVPLTTMCTRKQVPPSNIRQNARRASLDALDVATALPTIATAPSVAKRIRLNVDGSYLTPEKRAQLHKV